MYDRVASFGKHGRNLFEEAVFDAWRDARLASLSDHHSALVFGRIDRSNDETYYVGRRHVDGPGGETVVVDWRAPVATSFYRASISDPLGLKRRRHFLVEGRRLLGIADETFDRLAGEEKGLTSWDILREALERRRGGEMQDIVATIQAEQDVIIRSPLEGVVIVQGGPGTGKTAIGLHRAAYLLYEHRKLLSRAGVLVIGPNRIFMRFIAQVLPSLGEAAVEQRSIDALGPTARIELAEDRETAKLKGDSRLAEVIYRHIWARLRPVEEGLSLRFNGVSLSVPRSQVSLALDEARKKSKSYDDGRERFVQRLVQELYSDYQRPGPTPLSLEEFGRAVRKTVEFKKAARVWPGGITPRKVVQSLLGQPMKLKEAAENILTEDEQKRIRRRLPEGSRDFWSSADIPLLDEAHNAIRGTTGTFSHVIVDEAQDLSPMQLRMIGRRCPSGSMTVLGDLAQGTEPWAHESWKEVSDHLPTHAGLREEQLTIGYRVSQPVMTFAQHLIPAIALGLKPPLPVRQEGSVDVLRVSAAELPREAVARATALAPEGPVAVIVPTALLDSIRDTLVTAEADFGEARAASLNKPITLLAASDCKGLEFDSVVLAEPMLVTNSSDTGLRLLYIAMTRAMRDLVMIHSLGLPEPLADSEFAAAISSGT